MKIYNRTLIHGKNGNEEWAAELEKNNPLADPPILNQTCPQWMAIKLNINGCSHDPILSLFNCLSKAMCESGIV